MIRRLYVHNFRCLENFELNLSGRSSTLLIGNNGAGKSTVALALETLQRIARGTNRVRELVSPADLAGARTEVPLRFELELELESNIFQYSIAFELPVGFKELRVLEEKLAVDGRSIYSRELASVRLASTKGEREAKFNIDWHLVALPIIQQRLEGDSLSIFKDWIARIIILRPVPSLITGESSDETLVPKADVSNFGAWFSGILAFAPAAYSKIDEHLKQMMPDIKDIRNATLGKDFRSLQVQFSNEHGRLPLPFERLSDGEKCFMICALVLAATEVFSNTCCFWDEPDNFLALSEVSHFIMTLRRAFRNGGGQLIATSHNPEAIRSFSNENTFWMQRRSHLEPTTIRPLTAMEIHGDLIDAIIRGDVEQ